MPVSARRGAIAAAAAGAPIGAPTVRYQARTNFVGGSGTLNIVPTGNGTAGNRMFLIGCTLQGGAWPLTSVTDDAGNSWSVHASNSSGNYYVFMASAHMTTAITTTTNVTLHRTSVNNANYDMWMLEVSGLISGAAFDKSATSNGAGTSYSCGPTAALSQANELAFAAWSNDASATPGQSSVGGGFTGLGFAGTCTLVYKIAAATTALTASQTSDNASWVGVLGTFKGN